ncbi:MAG: hypothetical protein ACKPKO_41755, partial [Candidatus Fonsibacter sp.]
MHEVRPIIGHDEEEWPYEITFDGGACEVRGRRVAGARVVVWGAIYDHEKRRVLANCSVALPRQHYAVFAKALGCLQALRWLSERAGEVRAARVASDNLAVIRFC